MNAETRSCQNCKAQFTIEAEDLNFYEKVKVPLPTFCSKCRTIRRMLFRNECIWYRRKCDATGKEVLSMYAPERPYKVYVNEYWKSDAWDPMQYGVDPDFSKPFFSQIKELLSAVPHPNLIQKNLVNSDYANYAVDLKNCYFIGGATQSEDCAYMFGGAPRSRQCFDTFQSRDMEYSYEVVDAEKCNGVRFVQNCVACSDSTFLYDCRNCSSCVGCVGLRNKSFCIFNKQYSKEEYLKELERLKLGSANGLRAVREKFEALKLSTPRKFATILKSENVKGDDILNARNCSDCFSIWNDIENVRHTYRSFDRVKDGSDGFVVWNNSELFLDVFSVSGQRVFYSALIWGGFDIQYSYNCFDCNNIFGCVGLRNKSYCILNKQYSEVDYKALVPKIIEHMKTMPYVDARGLKYGYGEFFPAEFSPFAYNESAAQDFFPKTKEEALAEGFTWYESGRKVYQITKKIGEVPDDISDVSDSILQEVIECAHQGKCSDYCSTAFRIIPQELQFLKKFNLPLPRLCPICRRGERIRSRNPLRLWRRKCSCAGGQSANGVYKNTAVHSHGDAPCVNEFETSYASERKEIVYCEQCYNAEIV
ncbi:MAG: hypothetical protein FJY98_03665 [Candidatus Liptonbacteria bacterium]|nr:hypothetical protein [Candidatus Liptonbacteria bacterium]